MKKINFRRIGMLCMVMVMVLCMSVPAFAAETTTEEIDLRQVMTDSLTQLAADMMGMIAAILPIALGVVAAVLTISFGIKLFKKITGR